MRDVRTKDLLLGVILLGILGLIAELVLLEHTESWQQWIPLIALAVGLVTSGLTRLTPSRAILRAFQAVMVIFLVAGLFGLYLHYQGNVAFALERTPELSGTMLLWKALKGATPTLAPGALAQIGLIGLVYAYRYPAIEAPVSVRGSGTESVTPPTAVNQLENEPERR